MSGALGKRALQALLMALGVIAVVTGLLVVATGSDGIPGESAATATLDNELRFFAVFWIGFGVVSIRVAPRVDTETTLVRALALTLFVGGVARAVSWLSAGEPHPLFAGLMILELLGAPLVVLWQERLTRAAAPRSGASR